MKILYFKTYDKAVSVAKLMPDTLCINQYQWSNEAKCAKVREFDKGYAIQLGDCGDYVTKETMTKLGLDLPC
jgi:hypothetical protein